MKTRRIFWRCLALCLLLTQISFAQWTHVSGPTNDVEFLTADGTEIFAQTNTGFFYSSDYGIHWTQSNTGLGDSLIKAFPEDSSNFLLNSVLNQIPFIPGILDLSSIQIEYSSLIALVTNLTIQYPQTTIDSIRISLNTADTSLTLLQIAERLGLYTAGLDTTDILASIDTARLLFSTNGGAEWISFQSVLSSISVRGTAATEQYVFVGTNRGVFRAPAGSTDWQQVNFGLADTNVHALETIGTRLFAGTDGGVFVSTDDGSTWKSVNSGLTDKKVRALTIYGNSLFAGTQTGGVFLSQNYGSSWKAVNQGLSNLTVNALTISNNVVFAGTSGSGLWKRPVSQMVTSVSENNDAVPQSYSLSQNYPNPFNPSTVIEYALPVRSTVHVQILNILGQRVATLYDGEQGAGYQKLQWNANLASGMYYYRIEAIGTTNPSDRFMQVKKMLLLK